MARALKLCLMVFILVVSTAELNSRSTARVRGGLDRVRIGSNLLPGDGFATAEACLS
jgi:hypothetical protein